MSGGAAVFEGVSAFPLSPIGDEQVDTTALGRIVDRLTAAGVDSIGALGSTGAAPLLSREERATVLRTVVEHADGTPVIAGIGALRTRDVLAHADDAQAAGARALLLAPVSYQPLTADEVVELFRTVLAAVDVPVVLYDNPRTTRFTFTPELYARIAAMGGIAAVKVPGVPADLPGLRRLLPDGTAIGVAGDGYGAAGLAVGCDLWFSSIAGILPEPVLAIARGADPEPLSPLWALIAEHGGLRVSAVAARLLGLVEGPCLPAPVREPDDPRVAATLRELGLV
ncbi:dihydrodipicolinate synthase family protein [Cellulomonas sp. RIT-PI-Y]|uniref:dihydrodipicolinate synthase family protein n=1 Tax=Cellulomonas sp. RIT-PI-Y TaxID=3035297 RepID=UPI0021DA5B88|nr:dihydrodipicolinate synthase family protein [Cellulomonas sp. RIT-PI-Y]